MLDTVRLIAARIRRLSTCAGTSRAPGSANERLSVNPVGQVVLKLKTPPWCRARALRAATC